MFTEQQLEHIKSVARKKKNQGEISVWDEIYRHPQMSFAVQNLNVIKYCAGECKRQHSGEMSVYDMLVAWNYAHDHYRSTEYLKTVEVNSTFQITTDFISNVGTLVEPIDNNNGFRTIPIGVASGWNGHGYDKWDEKPDWREIPRLLTLLLESYYDGSLYITEEPKFDSYVPSHMFSESAEDEFYYQYEMIHPFVDGNGRSGKILYNYLLGRLDDPIMPPNFWNIANP